METHFRIAGQWQLCDEVPTSLLETHRSQLREDDPHGKFLYAFEDGTQIRLFQHTIVRIGNGEITEFLLLGNKIEAAEYSQVARDPKLHCILTTRRAVYRLELEPLELTVGPTLPPDVDVIKTSLDGRWVAGISFRDGNECLWRLCFDDPHQPEYLQSGTMEAVIAHVHCDGSIFYFESEIRPIFGMAVSDDLRFWKAASQTVRRVQPRELLRFSTNLTILPRSSVEGNPLAISRYRRMGDQATYRLMELKEDHFEEIDSFDCAAVDHRQLPRIFEVWLPPNDFNFRAFFGDPGLTQKDRDLSFQWNSEKTRLWSYDGLSGKRWQLEVISSKSSLLNRTAVILARNGSANEFESLPPELLELIARFK
jgi:hypothetical protein